MGRGKGGGNVRDILLGPSRYKTAKREKTRWENYLKTLERHFGKRPDAMFETPEGSPRLLDHITRLNLFNYLNHIYTDTPEQELNHFFADSKIKNGLNNYFLDSYYGSYIQPKEIEEGIDEIIVPAENNPIQPQVFAYASLMHAYKELKRSEDPLAKDYLRILIRESRDDTIRVNELLGFSQTSQALLDALEDPECQRLQKQVIPDVRRAKEIVSNPLAEESKTFFVSDDWLKRISGYRYDDGSGPSGLALADFPGIILLNKDKPRKDYIGLLTHEMTHVTQELKKSYFTGHASPRINRAIVEGITETETTILLESEGLDYPYDMDKPNNIEYAGYQYLIRSAMRRAGAQTDDARISLGREWVGLPNHVTQERVQELLFPKFDFEYRQNCFFDLIDAISKNPPSGVDNESLENWIEDLLE